MATTPNKKNALTNAAGTAGEGYDPNPPSKKEAIMNQSTDSVNNDALTAAGLDSAITGEYVDLSLPSTDRPCPPWCGLDSGHGWEGKDGGGTLSRFHVHHFGDVGGVTVDVTSEETAPCVACNCHNVECSHAYDAAGPSAFSSPVIYIGTPPDELPQGDGRRLAALLVAADRLLEGITAAPAQPGSLHLDGCTLDPAHREACILDRPFRIRPEGGREYLGGDR